MRSLRLPVLALLLLVVPAAAAQANFTVKGAPGPGPAKYDKVYVERVGSATARRVLVLVPGTNGGAGSMEPVARDIVRRQRGTQVWLVDRRQQAFEDTAEFKRGDPYAAQEHYLGFKYKRVLSADVPYVAEWGLKLSLEDLRRVVLKARAGGRNKVVLGGHSAGASTAVAYAAWDFKRRPGYRDIEGLVLIDGGLLGSFSEASARRARTELAELRSGKRNRFLDLLGAGIPEVGGIFTELAALYAAKAPDAPSALQQFPLLPEIFKPPFRVTNEAQLGYAFDATTSPEGFELIRVRAGGLAASGDPRGWKNGELTPIERFAAAFSGQEPSGTEWYYPYRLLLDIDAASPLRQTRAAKTLGLRLLHGRKIDVPVYAFETDLARGRIVRGARRLARMSRVPRVTAVADPRSSHLDPLVASPGKNRFLRTVLPFLRRIR